MNIVFFFSIDPRVADWFLIRSPVPIVCIFVTYLCMVVTGPRWMQDRKPFQLKWILIIYNGFQVALSSYMFYEFFVSAYLAGYSLTCQPVDFTMNPLSLRVIIVSPATSIQRLYWMLNTWVPLSLLAFHSNEVIMSIFHFLFVGVNRWPMFHGGISFRK